MNEIAKTNPNAAAKVPASGASAISSAGDMMLHLAEMSRDPSVSAEKIIALGEFQIKVYDRHLKEEFNKDLNNAIDQMPIITKDGSIKGRGNYSTFERLMSAVKPVLRDNNLRIRFDVISSNGTPEIASILTHSNGYELISGHMPVPISKPNNSVSMTDAAAMSVTRGKRHVLKATLSIIEEDDDGFGKHYIAVNKADWQDELIQTSMAEAVKGGESYATWYKSLPAMHRGYLVDTGQQEKNKTAIGQITP